MSQLALEEVALRDAPARDHGGAAGIGRHVVAAPEHDDDVLRRHGGRIVDLGEDGFSDVVQRIIKNLARLLKAHPGATPRFRGVQRRYPSQKSKPFIDAVIEFDLRTALEVGDALKTQPRWLAAWLLEAPQ